MESCGIDSEEILSREGAASYRLALAAIKEYEAFVGRKCREAVESEQCHITAAVGSPLKNFKELKQFEAATEYAALGICARGINNSKHCFALWWEKDKVYESVWTQFEEPGAAQEACERLRQVNRTGAVGANATEAWLRLEITGEEAGRPWDLMRKSIQQWSQAWSQIPGGLKQYLQ